MFQGEGGRGGMGQGGGVIACRRFGEAISEFIAVDAHMGADVTKNGTRVGN